MAAQLLELTHHARHARVRNAFKEIPLSPLSFTFLSFLPLPLLISDPIKSDLRMRMRKNGRQRERGNERAREREASEREHLEQVKTYKNLGDVGDVVIYEG